MQNLKIYHSMTSLLTTLWFGSLAGLLIEINCLFSEALLFRFFSSR